MLKNKKKFMIPVIVVMLIVAMAGTALAFTPAPAMTSFPLTKQSTSYNGYALAAQRIIDETSDFSLAVDGYFGTGTYTEVKNYQTSRGLTADGKIGYNTWAKLYSELELWTPQYGDTGYFYHEEKSKPSYGSYCNIENDNNDYDWYIRHDNGAMQLIN